MGRLRAEAAAGRLRHVDFLIRCHQAPAHAQLHSPQVRMTMLPCPPPTLLDMVMDGAKVGAGPAAVAAAGPAVARGGWWAPGAQVAPAVHLAGTGGAWLGTGGASLDELSLPKRLPAPRDLQRVYPHARAGCAAARVVSGHVERACACICACVRACATVDAHGHARAQVRQRVRLLL